MEIYWKIPNHRSLLWIHTWWMIIANMLGNITLYNHQPAGSFETAQNLHTFMLKLIKNQAQQLWSENLHMKYCNAVASWRPSSCCLPSSLFCVCATGPKLHICRSLLVMAEALERVLADICNTWSRAGEKKHTIPSWCTKYVSPSP